jgi:7-keto-8-aminopelargonate synthetase-like enzyme
VLDGFAAYRMMQRRFAYAARRGIMLPFFQPREGMSGATIRWNDGELVNYSGYNYLGLSGHPAVSRAAKDAIDRYGTSASSRARSSCMASWSVGSPPFSGPRIASSSSAAISPISR